MAEGYTTIASNGLIAVIVGWGFSSIIALAFRCAPPQPWALSGNCINQVCHSANVNRNFFPDQW